VVILPSSTPVAVEPGERFTLCGSVLGWGVVTGAIMTIDL
jgi:hypothetical protein